VGVLQLPYFPVKKSLLAQLKKVVYADTTEQFDSENEAFKNLCDVINLPSGGKYTELKAYYVNN
jgi:hypothetical protein